MTLDDLGNLLDHLPHNGWELVGMLALLAFLGQAVGGGVILRWHRNRNNEATEYRAAATADREELKTVAEAIKGQVVNGHTEPLRADIDALKDDFAELKGDVREIIARQQQWVSVMPMVRALGDEIRGLRADIAEERDSRRNLAADVRADMAKHRDDITAMDRRLRDATG